MLRPRVIPCLLMSKGGLVKTNKFLNPKYVGDPINAVKIYNEKQVDELSIFDIHAWRERSINFDLLTKIARESRMPLCYGGGVTTSDQATQIIQLGFEKVSLSSAAIRTPSLISDIANRIGSQSVVVTIDVRRNTARINDYSVFIENGSRAIVGDVLDLCKSFVEMGAGEIVINSIEREGELHGFDLELADYLFPRISVPMTFIGGCGKVEDMLALVKHVGIVGIGVGSYFVFKGPFRAVLINYSKPDINSWFL